MTLENVFYTMAIIFMSLGFALLIAIGILVFYIKKKVTDISEAIETQIDYISNHRADIAIGLGTAAAGAALKQVKKAMEKNNL